MQDMAHKQTETFRANLGSLCAEHGRVQEIADKAGLSRIHLSRIIHGHCVPTLDVAAKIADAVGVPLAGLLKKSSKKMTMAAN